MIKTTSSPTFAIFENDFPKMTEKPMAKTYDLEDRTMIFAKDTRAFVKQLPRTIANIEDIKQLVRASGSVGANYIEANDSLSKKDFLMRIKICRKEAKECRYWIQLIDTGEDSQFLRVVSSCIKRQPN